MGRSHRPRGEFNSRSRGGERSEFLSLSVPGFCAEQLDTGWFCCPVRSCGTQGRREQQGRDEPCPALEQPSVSLVPVISSELAAPSYQSCGVITHPSPKPTALMEVPLALKPLLEITLQSLQPGGHCTGELPASSSGYIFLRKRHPRGFSWATQSAEPPWRQAQSLVPTSADGLPTVGVPKLGEMLRMDNPDQFRNTQEENLHSGGVVFPFSCLSPHLAKATWFYGLEQQQIWWCSTARAAHSWASLGPSLLSCTSRVSGAVLEEGTSLPRGRTGAVPVSGR